MTLRARHDMAENGRAGRLICRLNRGGNGYAHPPTPASDSGRDLDQDQGRDHTPQVGWDASPSGWRPSPVAAA